MTPRQTKALQALLSSPTKKAAAEAAGISESTLRNYLADPAFAEAYKKALTGLVDDATRQAQQSLDPALTVLREIAEAPESAASAKISAARTLLEYGLRLTEITDIIRELEGTEG